jgi:flagellar export protein FliJ
MANRFPLGAVLRIRQHKEETEERALLALHLQRQQVETTLGRVREQLSLWDEDRQREVGSTTMAATRQSSYARLALLREAELQLLTQLRDLRERSAKQQESYLCARRNREVLTDLEQHQRQAWLKELDRREQHRVEDLFLGRWLR